MRAHGRFATRPDPSPCQAQDPARFGIQTQHRVKQHTAPRAFADRPKTAISPFRRGEIDLAGVLDRQNVQTLARSRKLFSPAIDNGFRRHPSVREKTRKSHNATAAAACQPSKADALMRDHSVEQKTPLFDSRSSPKSPASTDDVVILSALYQGKLHRIRPSLQCQQSQTKCVHPLARRRGRCRFARRRRRRPIATPAFAGATIVRCPA